jgi:hypothetical protein
MKKFLYISKRVLHNIGKIVFIISIIFFALNLLNLFKNSNSTTSYLINFKNDNSNVINKILYKKELSETKIGKNQIKLIKTITCISIAEGCDESVNKNQSNFKYSIFGLISRAINYPFINPPASGIYWISSVLQKSGLIPKSYANEGIGFAALKPLSGVWEIFRNISYSVIVIIMLLIGFMIMFRAKINPQTIISIENSLPRIVVTLLLITFSFAIAGFLIDLMYVVSGIVISLLSNNGVVPLPEDLRRVTVARSDWVQLWDMVYLNGNIWFLGPAFLDLLPTTINVAVRTSIGIGVTLLLKAIDPVNDVLSGKVCEIEPVGSGWTNFICSGVLYPLVIGLISFISPVIISLIIFLTTGLYVLFRVLFMLLGAYLRIVFMILFSPIILLIGAIPGKNMFGKWLKNIVSDLVLFPLTLALIYLSAIITNVPPSSNNFFQAPMLYSIYPEVFNIIIGMGLLFSIPNIAKAVRESMGIKESPFRIGMGAFFAGTAAIGATGMKGMQSLSSLGSLGMYGSYIPIIGKFFRGKSGNAPKSNKPINIVT